MITLNRYEHFKRSFQSFYSQDYSNRELVIVSDGSEEYKRSTVFRGSAALSATVVDMSGTRIDSQPGAPVLMARKGRIFCMPYPE
jgi:hypothetical protein